VKDGILQEEQWISWNGNISHNFKRKILPKSIEEIQEAVINSKSVRALAGGRSSADICAGTDTLIDIQSLDQITVIDRDQRSITVQAGCSLKKLLIRAESEGWALPCLPDIDVVSVGGAIATGTHGTNGHILAEYVAAITLVDAEGRVRIIEKSDPNWDAYKLSLGVLGIIVELKFQFDEIEYLQITEKAYKDEEWLAKLDSWLTEYRFVRILWLPHTNTGYVILGQQADEQGEHQQSGEPWYYQYRRKVSVFLYKISSMLPPFTKLANNIIRRIFFSSTILRSGSLYQATVTKKRGAALELSEWTVDRRKFKDVFLNLKREFTKHKAYAHIPMDIRFLKEDSTWLSYAYGQDIVTMGCVTRDPANADSYRAFEVIEKVFLEQGGRPHWAKRFQARFSTLKKLWPKWDEFTRLRGTLDPEGKFLNATLRKMFIQDEA
jgi:L-gulonolactone oxidase